jgi:hypothetical protein
MIYHVHAFGATEDSIMRRRPPSTHKPHGLQQAENPLDHRFSFQLLRTGSGVEHGVRVTTFTPSMATLLRYVILIDDRSYPGTFGCQLIFPAIQAM